MESLKAVISPVTVCEINAVRASSARPATVTSLRMMFLKHERCNLMEPDKYAIMEGRRIAVMSVTSLQPFARLESSNPLMTNHIR